MKFKVGNVVKLTKLGWENGFHRDPNVNLGALAVVKVVNGDGVYACEFFPPTKSAYLHDCNGKCANNRGRWMYEVEIECGTLPTTANIAKLFEEA